MAAVGYVPAQRLPRRCDHCGRIVGETHHTPTAYRVDYYSLHTGTVEPAALTTDGGVRVHFVKLMEPAEITTCAACYRLPAVRRERDDRFRPERVLSSGEDDANA